MEDKDELEIKDKTILIIAVVSAIVGIAILFFIAEFYQDDIPSNTLMQYNSEGEVVKITGKIKKISETEKVVFLVLLIETTVDATVFTDESLTIHEGDLVEITGKVNTYNDKKSIVVDEMKKVEKK